MKYNNCRNSNNNNDDDDDDDDNDNDMIYGEYGDELNSDLYDNCKYLYKKHLINVDYFKNKCEITSNNSNKQDCCEVDNKVESISSSDHEIDIDSQLCNCVKCKISYHESYIMGITDINMIKCKKCKIKLIYCKCCLSKSSSSSSSSTFNQQNVNKQQQIDLNKCVLQMNMNLDKVKHNLYNLSESSLELFELLINLIESIKELKNDSRQQQLQQEQQKQFLLFDNDLIRQAAEENDDQSNIEKFQKIIDNIELIDDTNNLLQSNNELTSSLLSLSSYSNSSNSKLPTTTTATTTSSSNTTTNARISDNMIGSLNDDYDSIKYNTLPSSTTAKITNDNSTQQTQSSTQSPSTTTTTTTITTTITKVTNNCTTNGLITKQTNRQSNRKPSFKFDSNILNRVQAMQNTKTIISINNNNQISLDSGIYIPFDNDDNS